MYLCARAHVRVFQCLSTLCGYFAYFFLDFIISLWIKTRVCWINEQWLRETLSNTTSRPKCRIYTQHPSRQGKVIIMQPPTVRSDEQERAIWNKENKIHHLVDKGMLKAVLFVSVIILGVTNPRIQFTVKAGDVFANGLIKQRSLFRWVEITPMAR